MNIRVIRFFVTIQLFPFDEILPVIASSRRKAGAPVRLLADGDLFVNRTMRSRRRSAPRDDG